MSDKRSVKPSTGFLKGLLSSTTSTNRRVIETNQSRAALKASHPQPKACSC
jgi:hypothetical protein